jgi:hypothetical protein
MSRKSMLRLMLFLLAALLFAALPASAKIGGLGRGNSDPRAPQSANDSSSDAARVTDEDDMTTGDSETGETVEADYGYQSDKGNASPNEKFTVLGVYTSVRFNRGQFLGYMPMVGEDFFARERTSLRHILARFFALSVQNERLFTVEDPMAFDRMSDDVYKKIYDVYSPAIDITRFNLSAVSQITKEIDARFFLLGDVTKLNIKEDRDKRTFSAEVAFYLYDTATSAIVFQQSFKAETVGSKDPPPESAMENDEGKATVMAFADTDLGKVFVNIADQLVTALKEWVQRRQEAPATGEESVPAGTEESGDK